MQTQSIDGLVSRILAARIVKEHHVWDVAKSLSQSGPKRLSDDQRFLRYMEADALIEAVLYLVGSSQHCSLEAIRRVGRGWECTIRRIGTSGQAGRNSLIQAFHPDLAAALLHALVQAEMQHFNEVHHA